jgi:hypothetical protein
VRPDRQIFLRKKKAALRRRQISRRFRLRAPLPPVAAVYDRRISPVTVQQPIRRVRAAGRRYRIPIQASGSRTPAIKELLRAL